MKKILSILISVALILSCMTVVYADESIITINSRTENILIKGQLDEGTYTAGDDVTILLHKADASLSDITAADVGYINQTTINSDGSYYHKFKFTDGTVTGTSLSDYTLSTKIGANDVTSSVVSATSQSVFVGDVKLTANGNNALNLEKSDMAKISATFENYYDDAVTLTGIIAFYDKDGKLIDAYTDGLDFGYSISSDDISCEIPDGALSAKCFIWKDLESVVPVVESIENDMNDYKENAHIFLIGDSLGEANKVDGSAAGGAPIKYGTSFAQGWNYYFLEGSGSNAFYYDKATIHPHAKAGWNTDNFLNEQSWSNYFDPYPNIVAEIEAAKTADPSAKMYVVLSLGTNDGWWDGTNYRIQLNDWYGDNLNKFVNGYALIDGEHATTAEGQAAEANGSTVKYIKGTKELGAELIFISPAAPVKEVSENYYLKEAGQIMKSIADANEGVYFVDTYTETYDLFYNQLGQQGARDKYFRSYAAYEKYYGEGTFEDTDGDGVYEQGEYYVAADGETKYSIDYLHYNAYGAEYIAKLFMRGLGESDSSIKYYINEYAFGDTLVSDSKLR